MARRPFFNWVVYPISKMFVRMVAVVFYRMASHGSEILPKTEGAIIVANHQSHFDPVLVGMCCERPLIYLARDTLFRFRPFAWLIRYYQAIPVRREGMGLDGLKEVLRRVRDNEIVLLFPEGTRTPDGEIHQFKPGITLAAKRAGVPVIPAAVEGPFEIWPRGQKFPRLRGVIQVEFGDSLTPEQISEFDDRALLAEMQRRVEELHVTARDKRTRRMK